MDRSERVIVVDDARWATVYAAELAAGREVPAIVAVDVVELEVWPAPPVLPTAVRGKTYIEERGYDATPGELNRKARRREAARKRDKRWRVKL